MEFRKCTLGDLSLNGRGEYGIAASAVEYNPEKKVYLRITDICDDGTLDNSDRKSVEGVNLDRYILKPNDIVFARTGASTGRNYFYDGTDGEMVFAGFLIKFSIDERAVNPKFIKYYCLSKKYKAWIQSFATGSTRGNINAQTLASMPIDLPPRDYQNRMVEILDIIDLKIKENKAINHNLQQQAEALYKKTFPYSVRDELPDNWHIGTVRDIIDLHDSKRIPLSSRERDKMTMKIYPYYGATSVMDHVEAYIFDGCYLLLGEDGTVIDDYGHPILQYVWGKFWVNNHAHIISGKNGFMVESLYLFFKQLNVRSIVTGAVQPKISQANLCSVPVVIPPEEVIRAFNEQIMPFFTMIRTNTDENARLSSLRDSLLPRIMAGEIDVSDIDI